MKKTVLIVLIGIVSIFQSNAQEEVIAKALKAMDGEKYETALKLLKSTEEAEAQYYIGDIYMKQKKYDAAEKAFKKGIEMDDDLSLNYVGMARINLMNGDSTAASANIETAIDELPRRVRSPKVYIEIMQAYADAGLFNKAIPYGEKAINVGKVDADLLVALGNMYAEQNSRNLSIPVNYYNRAIAIDSTNAEAYTRLAVAWSRAKMPDRAEKFFKKAIKANPKYAPAYREEAIFFYRNDRLQEAIDVYGEKYLPLVDYTCETVTRYIQFVFLAGDAETAINEINKLKQSQDCHDLPEMGRMEGYSAYETGNYQQAATALTDFLQNVPEYKIIPADYVYLGKAQLKLDSTMYDDGMKNFHKALTLVDTSDKVSVRKLYDEMISSLEEDKFYLKVAQMYKEKIDRFKPYNGYTTDLRDMALAYGYGGAFKKADSSFTELLKIDSTYIYGYFMRAQLNTQAGMSPDTAMFFYNKIIELCEDQPEKYGTYLGQAYKYKASYYYGMEVDEDKRLQKLDSTILYYDKWYQLDTVTYKQVGEALHKLQDLKKKIIIRRKKIAEYKAAKAKAAAKKED